MFLDQRLAPCFGLLNSIHDACFCKKPSKEDFGFFIFESVRDLGSEETFENLNDAKIVDFRAPDIKGSAC